MATHCAPFLPSPVCYRLAATMPLQALVGMTPERARAERRQLAERAEQAEAEVQAAQQRVQRLEAVLAFEVRACWSLSPFLWLSAWGRALNEHHALLTKTCGCLGWHAAIAGPPSR